MIGWMYCSRFMSLFLTSGRSEAKARNRGHLFIAAAAV
jgi:hypothetical protein